jgi:hypothetical protein
MYIYVYMYKGIGRRQRKESIFRTRDAPSRKHVCVRNITRRVDVFSKYRKLISMNHSEHLIYFYLSEKK